MLRFLSLLVVSVSLIACGGGGDGTTSPPTPAPVATIGVTLAAPTVVVGSNTTASAVARDDRGNALSGRPITWTSSTPSVATVDATGTITTFSTGSTNIVATAEGRSGTASLIVIPPPVATVSIVLAQSTIAPNATTNSTVTLRDANGAVLTGRAITYTSSSPAVATVSAAGVVSAIAVGTTNITATSEGKSASALLTVQLPPVASVTVTGALRVKVGDNYTYSAVARLADGTIVNRPMVWSVREPARGSITAAGVLTPLQTGTLTLQVTIDGAVWESTNAAYDWDSFASSGSLFTSIEADNLVTNKFGTSDYPSLIMSCSATGVFFLWVSTTNIVTANGVVAFSFDGGTPFAQTWDELSPSFRTLWKPGNNGAIKAFASQVSASRTFTFAFSEFQGSTKATTFRVGGLASRLTPLLAQCASNAIVAESGMPSSVLAGATSAMSTVASFVQVSEEFAALQATRAARGASATGVPSIREAPNGGVMAQQAVRRRPH